MAWLWKSLKETLWRIFPPCLEFELMIVCPLADLIVLESLRPWSPSELALSGSAILLLSSFVDSSKD